MVERFERFSLAVAEISRYWHKIAGDEMEKYGLKGPHATYLTAIYRCEDGVTAPQLCEMCGKDKSDVSRTMTAMERGGLVVKEGIHQNRYGGVFKLTEAGKKAAEAVRARAALAVEIAGRDLTDDARTTFYEALEGIVQNLRELSKTGLPQEKER